jgi:hypothetical protein
VREQKTANGFKFGKSSISVTIALILKIVFRIHINFIEANKNQWVFCDLENNNANNDKHNKSKLF